jgi:hypothetical protein
MKRHSPLERGRETKGKTQTGDGKAKHHHWNQGRIRRGRKT